MPCLCLSLLACLRLCPALCLCCFAPDICLLLEGLCLLLAPERLQACRLLGWWLLDRSSSYGSLQSQPGKSSE